VSIDLGGRVAIRYIGSKSRIADQIAEQVGLPTCSDGVFVDAFAGTGSISRAVADNGWIVRANDSLRAASILTAARLVGQDTVSFPSVGGYHAAQRALNDVEPVRGFIWRTYSPASERVRQATVSRRYFTEANAALIDAQRRLISMWASQGMLSRAEEWLLLADLLTAANRVANTAGTYGCFLREWTKSALRPLRLTPRELPEEGATFEVLNGDVTEIPVREEDVLYLDPPYTKRQYAAYYHVPETIAHGDEPEVSGVTGLRPWRRLASDFCYRTRALDALVSLISRTASRRIHLSYSSEGHVDLGELVDALSRVGEVSVTWLADVGRYRPNSGAVRNGSVVSEYLLYILKPDTATVDADVRH